YSRIANPTVHYLEETLALLEGYGFDGDVSAVATSSGMSAVFMATNPFLEKPEPGMNIVVSARCYGGTFMLFGERYGAERGIDVRWVRDPLDLNEWADKIDGNTRFVYGETPSNPSLSIMDIEAVADIAHAAGLPLIVDSTVATPALTRPFLLGADIVIHSTTKSMTSSGFAIGGAVIARHNITTDIGPDAMRENFAMYVKLLPFRDHGPGISPFNALMTINDLRTLRHRMDTVSTSSMKVAQYLESHDMVDRVAYPGLDTMPGHDVATRNMWLVDAADDYGTEVNRYGHLLAFEVKGGATAARQVFDGFEMIWRATDLGRIKSVATIPAISTHQQQGDEGRDLASVPPNLIRLNVGGEHPDDVIADLDRALATLSKASIVVPTTR
ncbi:MAG: O-acetylhomoserine aminocarboxypropyltransferase/cysteine synthase, partial [bacterium]|nr:O-acetylhomoserine aminocarboxypropyltransferase/cysteine synthase [bacterium]